MIRYKKAETTSIKRRVVKITIIEDILPEGSLSI